MKSMGASSAEFYDSGSSHEITLEWDRPGLGSFPITITIDGELVAESRVFVENWPLALWPLVLLTAAAVWIFWRLG